MMKLAEGFELDIDVKGRSFIGAEMTMHLDGLFHIIRQLKIKRGTITITLHPDNTKLDMSVLAFILLKKQTLEFEGISIQLDIAKLPASHALLFKLRQYTAFAYYFGATTELLYRNKQLVRFNPLDKANWMNISLEYIPVFLIDKTNPSSYKELFETTLPTGTFENWQNEPVTYEEKRTAYLNNQDTTITNYTMMVCFSAFAKLPAALRKKLNVKTGGETYLSKLAGQLCEQPIYLILVFSMLLYHDHNRLKECEKSPQLYQAILEILSKSHRQYAGIKEIVINIMQHAGSGKGVVTGRYYCGSDLRKIHENNPSFNKYYLSYLEINSTGEEDYFLELTVLDESTMGILDNYTPSLRKLGQVFNIYRDQPAGEHTVFLKTLAKLGLVSFQAAVIASDGFFTVKSPFENIASIYTKFGNEESEEQFSNLTGGTIYTVILPVLHKHVISNLEFPVLEKMEPDNFNQQHNFHFVPHGKITISEPNSEQEVLLVEFIAPIHRPATGKYDYETNVVESYKEILHQCRQKFPVNPVIPVLNLCQSACSENLGYFIRTLAGLILETEYSHLIVTNIQSQMLESLINLLKTGTKFWGTQTSLLMYIKSRIDPDVVLPVPILMTADSYEDFINYNRSGGEIDLDPGIQYTKYHSVNSPFYNSRTEKLIPAEMFIEVNKLSLFESFAAYCLNKEILTQ